MKWRYGLIGLFSVVGIMGLLIRDTSLYPFLAFAIFFEYLLLNQMKCS